MTGNSLFFTVCLVFPLDGLLAFVAVRVAAVVLFFSIELVFWVVFMAAGAFLVVCQYSVFCFV